MATNSPADRRKPLRTHQAVKAKSAYRTIEVGCLDLARLLDWCDSSVVLRQDGSTFGIHDSAWYRDAYVQVEHDFAQFISQKGGSR